MDQSTECLRPTRVLLVDRSARVLQKLKSTISRSPSTVVVGTARTQGEAMALLLECRPDVVVLDTQVGHASGLDLCRTIRESHPRIGVLFLTDNDDKFLLRSAILAGAQGYLLKQASSRAVAKAVEVVAAGQAIVDRQLTQEIIKWVCDQKGLASRTRLKKCSKSDMRVLSLLAAGKNNKAIARQLNMTPEAFLARLRGIYKRLNISRRAEAASYVAWWEQQISKD